MCILHLQFISVGTNHIPSAYKSHVAGGYNIGQYSSRSFLR